MNIKALVAEVVGTFWLVLGGCVVVFEGGLPRMVGWRLTTVRGWWRPRRVAWWRAGQSGIRS